MDSEFLSADTCKGSVKQIDSFLDTVELPYVMLVRDSEGIHILENLENAQQLAIHLAAGAAMLASACRRAGHADAYLDWIETLKGL